MLFLPQRQTGEGYGPLSAIEKHWIEQHFHIFSPLKGITHVLCVSTIFTAPVVQLSVHFRLRADCDHKMVKLLPSQQQRTVKNLMACFNGNSEA